MESAIDILVVEDDDTDYYLLTRLLRQYPQKRLVRAQSMEEGLETLVNHDIDAILLDLTLPDSQGTDTVKEFVKIESIPVVVLSGLDNEETALESVQLGAQEYLFKGSFDTTLLLRTIRHAIERHRLQRALNASQQQLRQERELRRLQTDASLTRLPSDTAVGAEKSLRATHEDVFKRSTNEYSSMVDAALEKRSFKVEGNISNALRTLATDLGSYRATPRDIVEIHTVVLTSKQHQRLAEKNRILNEEARYILTGLLGHLCSFYRSDLTRFSPSPALLSGFIDDNSKE